MSMETAYQFYLSPFIFIIVFCVLFVILDGIWMSNHLGGSLFINYCLTVSIWRSCTDLSESLGQKKVRLEGSPGILFKLPIDALLEQV